MYCEKYNCTMTEEACIKRQERPEKTSFASSAVGADPECKTCLQGAKVKADHLEKALKEDFPEVENQRSSKTEAPADDSTSTDLTSTEDVKMRTCKKCDYTGPLTDFAKNKASKDGHTNECKKCHTKRTNANNKKRRQAAASLKKKSLKTPATEIPPKEKTKTCKNPECRHTGPLDDFVRNKKSKDGHSNECKECAKTRLANWSKHKEKELEDKIRKELEPEIRLKIKNELEFDEAMRLTTLEIAKQAKEGKITIDFKDHPDTLTEIIKKAKDEIRSPEAQILYMLKEGIR